MLFILNKTQSDTPAMLRLLGGDEEISLLLVGDAAFWASSFMMEKFNGLDIEEVYVAQDAIETRKIDLSHQIEPVDYERMVELILEEDEKVIMI